MNVVNLTKSQPSAGAIARDLKRMGWTEGPPPHIRPEIVEVDRRIYQRLKCAACGNRGHRVEAWHRGREYTLIAACRKCGAGTVC